tara:strand:+ start:940 stop:1278 length:339 start_codon:yes stop_codon:yes gene_type:complete
MNKLLIIIFGITLLTSCKASMALHPERMSLGMTKSEVKIAMGEHIPMKIIGSKAYETGVIEVGMYKDRYVVYGQGVEEEIYYLYFLNDELIQWGRPQDWQKEADRIYEIRHR